MTEDPLITADSFVLENASVPPEVEAAIDKRSSMSAIGNLNDFVRNGLEGSVSLNIAWG